MTLVSQVIDGMGQIGTRVYPSVAAMPAPRLGALAIVDGGTGGQLYVGLHDVGGTLAWIPYSALYQALLTNPPPGHNTVVDSGVGDHPLFTQGSNSVVFQADNVTALVLEQTDTAPVGPILEIQRSNSTPAQPIENVFPDGTTDVITINGYGEITTRSYSALPVANTNHLGAIVRLLGGSGVQDTFWLCVLNSGGAPAWVQFQGPPGPAGPAGATGPAGPTGPAGAQGLLSFPALPDATHAITFQLIMEAVVTVLPYRFPAGYTVQFLGLQGYWRFNDALGNFITSGAGSDQNASNGKPLGQLVWQEWTVDSHGIETSIGTLEAYTTAITIANANDFLVALMNININDPQGGYLLATIRVQGSSLTWHAHIDFTIVNGGFSAHFAGSGTWTSGTGWQSGQFINGDHITGIWIRLALSSATTVTSIEYQGSLTIAGGLFYSAGGEAGITQDADGLISYSKGMHLTSGAFDYIWGTGVGHDFDTASPDTINLLGLFLYAWDSNVAGGGSSTITTLDIHGTGAVPAELVPYLV